VLELASEIEHSSLVETFDDESTGAAIGCDGLRAFFAGRPGRAEFRQYRFLRAYSLLIGSKR